MAEKIRPLARVERDPCERICRELIEDAPIGVFRSTFDGRLMAVNQALARTAGFASVEEMLATVRDLGQELYLREDQRRTMIAGALKSNGFVSQDVELRRRDGERLTVRLYARIVHDGNGIPVCLEGFLEDMTQRRHRENVLAHDKRRLEALLVERALELDRKAAALSETNVALKVLLKEMEDEKETVLNTITRTIRTDIQPLLTQFRKSRLNENHKAGLDLLEAKLEHMVSSLQPRPAASPLATLTPTQYQIANLIKDGIQNKQIADHLQLSIRTVEVHRYNIRRKLGLKNQGVRLQAYLKTLG